MTIICKNCGHHFKGNYCNHCGQTAETHKLDLHFIWHDLQHAFLHFDKGALYSFKQLFTRPGHSIREFLEGKRVKHFKPISLVIIAASIYGLLYHYFHINVMGATASEGSQTIGVNLDAVNEWMATHFSWATLLNIPLFTVGTAIAFRKQGYNFIEYFVFNAFKASQKLFVRIAAFPVLYYFNETPHIKTVVWIFYVTDLVLIFWTNIQFFNKLSPAKAFLLSVLSHIIFLVCFIVMLFVIILGYKLLH